ncbi:leucine-rich repeat-containing protein 26-like [Dreissena polymorpha]|uniref:leucine-rich repeat-containing protein 26-like n=1 Tax=Dreissena polymorpha TaxID=45954 RepID=UPI0022655B5E|nr:leucine-rich repeat-containing protein 26-like [Dreissena polymorpha]
MSNLTYLDLQSNRLRNIPQATFRGLTKLLTLFLNLNGLESIDDGVFEEVPNLNSLSLTGNRVRISQKTFRSLIKLKSLGLAINQLESIDDGVFEGLPNLDFL